MRKRTLFLSLATVFACYMFVIPMSGFAQETEEPESAEVTEKTGNKMMHECAMMGEKSGKAGKGMHSDERGKKGGKGMKRGEGMHDGSGKGMMGDCKMMSIKSDSTPLSSEVKAAIGVALQDEYRSEAQYQRVLAELGDVSPFNRIVKAEQMHAKHLVDLLEAHGADVPESKWTPENSETYATVVEACEAAITSEVDNVAIYDDLLSADLPDDVRAWFEHLQMMSRDRHLPAFRKCANKSDAG